MIEPYTHEPDGVNDDPTLYMPEYQPVPLEAWESYVPTLTPEELPF